MSNKSITITGTVHALHETKQVSASFTKRDFVVMTDDPKYPMPIPVTITGDKIGQLNGFQIGDGITVECNLRGREWKSPSGEVKTFLELSAWKVQKSGTSASRGDSHAASGYGGTPDDGIPF